MITILGDCAGFQVASLQEHLLEQRLPEENLRVTEVAAWLPSPSRQRQARDKGRDCAVHVLHLQPLPAPHGQATSEASAETSGKDYGDIYIYVCVCFEIIKFTNQNKEERQVVLAEEPRGLVRALQGSAVSWG